MSEIFQLHHILFCSQIDLIQSFFMDVLLVEEEDFQYGYFKYGEQKVFLVEKTTKADQLFPLIIHISGLEGDFEELRQRVEFWQYRYQSSLVDFKIEPSEKAIRILDPCGQEYCLLSNVADSCAISEHITL